MLGRSPTLLPPDNRVIVEDAPEPPSSPARAALAARPAPGRSAGRAARVAGLAVAVLLLAAAAAVLTDSPSIATLGLLAGVVLLAFERRDGGDAAARHGPGGKLALGLAALLCAASGFAAGRPAPTFADLPLPPPAPTPRPTQIPGVSVTVPAPTVAAAAPAPTVPPAAPPAIAAAPEPAGCAFQNAFASLRYLLGPEWVGDCLDDERDADNGEVVQRTTGGILVWRRAIGSAAFSDGQDTWANGPRGVQKRLNNERFAWELPAATPILPAQRVVTYYGNPLSPAMGILGELPADEMIWYLQQEIRAYATADPKRPVVGALELIATVAQASPGPDGLYRQRMDPALIERVAQLAESHGYLLILDVQPGRAAVADEVQALLPFLRRPYVQLAVDPEFAMGRNQRPGEVLGSVDATSVNAVAATLGELVEQEKLPPKLLVVHRFTEPMLTNARAIKPGPNVQVVVTMDGFGDRAAKLQKYDSLIRAQPVQFAGFKLFYTYDRPVIQPPDVLNLDPQPDLVIYQ